MNQKTERYWILAGACFVALIISLSLRQGANWDEPWLMQRAHALLRGDPIPPFKPFSGLLLVPVVMVGGEYLTGRMFFLGFQSLLGWGLFRLLPSRWPRWVRGGAVLVLWMEPTFRERVLELRTDGPAIALLACLTPWVPRFLQNRRPWTILTPLPFLALGMAVAPKLGMWALPWWFLMPMVLPWELRRESWMRVLKVTCRLLLVGLIVAGIMVWNSSKFEFMKAIAAATLTPMGPHLTFLPPVTTLYLGQTLRLGWPFWMLALAGLAHLAFAKEEWRKGSPMLLWELAGWSAAVATLFYAGAFPYHFLGVAAGVWPSVIRSLRWLYERWGQRAIIAAGCISLTALSIALEPVLLGPSLREQENVMAMAISYLRPGRGYVDGVGWFAPPQSAPFVTAQVMASGGAKNLWEIWEREHVSVFVLNGRTEQLMNEENIRWAREHFVQPHPNLLVPGRVLTVDRATTTTLPLHLDGQFLVMSQGDSKWVLDGISLRTTMNHMRLQAGIHTLVSSGPGRLVIQLEAGEIRSTSEILHNFFLPFQR